MTNPLCLRLAVLAAMAVPEIRAAALPPLEEAITAVRDVWGEAAMAQPNGPSYEFLAPLLPPPRYVNADFRHYPIILCPPGEIPSGPVEFRRGGDPGARPKARLISDGSGLNLRGGSRSWNDVGIPVRFRVGPDEFAFGSLRDRVTEPVLAEGWLPIPEIRYAHRTPVQAEGMVPLRRTGERPPAEIYRLEAFAATEAGLAEHCVVFVRFDLTQGTNGFVAVEVDAPGLRFEAGNLLDEAGRVVAAFDPGWKRERGRMVARVREGGAVTLAVPTTPLPAGTRLRVDPSEYAARRAACVETWRGLVGRAAQVEVPEARINHAWRNAIVQNFQLINHGQLRYSTGNQYDQIYSAEGSDAALALLSWGYAAEARRLLEPLFDFTRRNLELHQAAFKLGNLVRYVWQTRDIAAIEELRPRWETEIARFLEGRTGPGGLFPRSSTAATSTPRCRASTSTHGPGGRCTISARCRQPSATPHWADATPRRRRSFAPSCCRRSTGRAPGPRSHHSSPSRSTGVNRCTVPFCISASGLIGTSSSATRSGAGSSRRAARRSTGFRITKSATAGSSSGWCAPAGTRSTSGPAPSA